MRRRISSISLLAWYGKARRGLRVHEELGVDVFGSPLSDDVYTGSIALRVLRFLQHVCKRPGDDSHRFLQIRASIH
jgi:hypothetical protein